MTTKLFHLLTTSLLLAAATTPAQVVTTTADTGAGSLRSVVAGAAAGATVTFAPALSGQTIVLTNGAIGLNRNITIDASALPNGIVLMNGWSGYFMRLFNVASNVTVNLKHLTLTGGTGGIGFNDSVLVGGAIWNLGSLTLTECSLIQNNAASSVLSLGGAIYNDQAATLVLNRCTFDGNSATGGGVGVGGASGGAICNDAGTVTISQCTFTRNSALGVSGVGSGGAIFSTDGGLTNSTGRRLTINQSTITANAASGQIAQGGGVYSDEKLGFLIFNSIMAGNTATDNANISGAYAAKGTNLVSGDPLLLPLGLYGGPTQTMPPRTNSPAVNAGSDFTDVTLPGNTNFVPTTFIFPNDQRGWPRLFGVHVDIGAVELQTASLVTNLNDAGPGSLRQAVSGVDLADMVINFAPGLSGQSIQLESTLLLTNRCIIDASGLPGGIQLLGSYRVLEVAAGCTAELRSMTVRNGFDTQKGAGIFNQGSLTLDRCTIADNGGTGEIITSSGGGIYNISQLTLNQCTIAGNRAHAGAGIYNHPSGAMVLNQCTISGNESSFASGGIMSYGNLMLFNCIVAGNQGGGVYDPDLTSGSLATTGANLIGGNPLLAGLGNYGGPTPTLPPLPGSPALDAGADSATNNFTTDQRGGWRRSGGGVDIGAVEVVAASNVRALLGKPTRLENGTLQFDFTNLVAAGFTVYASTNVSAPFNTWSNLGPAVETPLGSGHYQFTDPMITNHPQRFYRVRSP